MYNHRLFPNIDEPSNSPTDNFFKCKRLENMPNFKATDTKPFNGFHIKFKNNYTVSVQFGEKTYAKLDYNGGSSAETAIFNPTGTIVKYNGNYVETYQTPEQVLKLMIFVESITSKNDICKIY